MKYGDVSKKISTARFIDEETAISDLLHRLQLDEAQSRRIAEHTQETVEALRNDRSLDLLEEFLAEYGLSTDEGIALMCLAEAYLRTPDASSLDALIRDKIGSGHWEQHLGTARSMLINASSWGLMLTGKIIGQDGPSHEEIRGTLKNLIRRLSEPAIRKSVEQVMKILGRQFVLGSTIEKAMHRAADKEKLGYKHSYDMLGEAALTDKDARAYMLSYSKAITAIAEKANAGSALDNPGISVKLSALHPRYETVQFERVMRELTPRVASLAQLARSANIGFTIDAEESERLEISLNVIRQVLQNPTLQGWDGFGVVVQAYSKQAPAVIDFLYALASKLERKITLRLVKGAYWDYEIKNAQIQGLQNYPVFTRKQSTDLCYLVCAEKLMAMTDRIFPQFATHNAHTVHSILEIAGENPHYEFQRLHGMGEALHERLREQTGKASRIYAPVGIHKDLLAYLVRRLLENGANSSFIHQLHDDKVPSAVIAADPVQQVRQQQPLANPAIPLPPQMFHDKRKNSAGLSLNLPALNQQLDKQMQSFRETLWNAGPAPFLSTEGLQQLAVKSPIDGSEVGTVQQCGEAQARDAIDVSLGAFADWRQTTLEARAGILERIAELYEANQAQLIALATREAGKTRLDGILEVREAVDFCRFYAAEAREKLPGFEPRGAFVCISPWNFPLAIFTGQIVAALVTGNTVLAKPAESTALTAALAVKLMHQAGVPEQVLILLPGEGSVVGSALTSDPRIAGVCFTGSTETAARIDRALAEHAPADTPLIAETGGINAMIVDSTALPEQAVKHIVSSAFQSAGQRCSALRLLLLQEEAAPGVLAMLEGASMELAINDPWQTRVDVGPIINQQALDTISQHCQRLEKDGRLLFKVPLPADIPDGSFISPAAFRLDAFEELEREIFGPVLHVLT
ncbi:MAG: bifunctional proline dehydrogenase/L-glutamate gamma-semialdehyde dehydrogenase PutA, partial [Gammaproteobacteria bacterium]|nr:bifunctional proline dehydrogenase/L-glutamate gamma-semialdehyde dehydrogenase PutA [Gammaproteobacteria bacterium]